jgi:hypothetical protein
MMSKSTSAAKKARRLDGLCTGQNAIRLAVLFLAVVAGAESPAAYRILPVSAQRAVEPAREAQQPQQDKNKENEKKLPPPEDKATSAKLRERSGTLAQALRDMNGLWRSASQIAMAQLKGQELKSKLSEIDRTYQSRFVIEFKNEALTLESDLIKRLGTQKDHGGSTMGARALHSGTLAGADSLNAVASYLEDLATELE